MKFQTNFSFPLGRLVPVLVMLGWGLSLFLVILGLSMGTSALRYRQENPALGQELEKLRQDPPNPGKPAAMPSDEDLSELRRHLRALGDLEAGQGRGVASVLYRLEGLLPAGARLLSFQQDQRSGEVQLVVEAGNLEELSRFLAKLESDDAFTHVNLTKQSQSQGGRDHWIQFSVDMMENLS